MAGEPTSGIFIGCEAGGANPQQLELKRANRHGLIAGATGTGKTVTLQGIVEGMSSAGIPCFVADVKGDLSGLAMAGSPTSKIHMPTCLLSAVPLPVIAALTSDGVCSATGSPLREAHRIATAEACAVPITVLRLCWAKTRSTATASGFVLVEPLLDAGLDRHQPGADLVLGGGADHPGPDQVQRRAGPPLDGAEPAPGKPGIDPHHPQFGQPHRHASARRTPVRCQRLYRVRAGRARPSRGAWRGPTGRRGFPGGPCSQVLGGGLGVSSSRVPPCRAGCPAGHDRRRRDAVQDQGGRAR